LERWSLGARVTSLAILLVLGTFAWFLSPYPYNYMLTAVMVVLAFLTLYGRFILCPFLHHLEKICPILQIKRDPRYSPHRILHQKVKLKLMGVESLKKSLDPIFLCTACDKCGRSDTRLEMRESLINSGILPHNLPYLRKAISEYGNPYSSPRARHDFLGKDYKKSSDTALFIGCTSSVVPRLRKLATSAAKLLDESGVEFKLLSDESCCGYILHVHGDFEKAGEIARQNMKTFKEKGVKRIITICPGCYQALKTFYPLEDIEVRHILEIVNPRHLPKEFVLTLHDPDHMGEFKEIARKLLKDCNVNESSYPCCGANLISYAPKFSMEIAKQMVDESKGLLVTYCPSCYLVLSRVARDKVIDLYSLLLSH